MPGAMPHEIYRVSQSRNPSNRQWVNSQPCTMCGLRHKFKTCPAWGKNCNRCGQRNHFAACCKEENLEKIQSRARNEIGVIEQFAIDEITRNNPEHHWMQPVIINGRTINFKIDTGADLNVLPLKVAVNLKANIERHNCQAVTYTGQEIPLIGHTHLCCTVGVSNHEIEFVVVDLDKPPLLGLQECVKLGLIKRMEIHTVCSSLSVEVNKDIFEGLGRFPFIHSIRLSTDFQPFIEHVRRVPYALHDRLKTKLEEMERQGIIQRVLHPTEVVNPVVVVEKKNGDLRVCLDMRRLNKFVMREHYMIPTVDDIARSLEGKSVFTVLDLKDGYYHVELDERSSDLCTFGTVFGRYKFKRLPFGIKSAPEIFQRHVTRLFGDIPGVCVYFDDILVAGSNEEEHDIK